MGLAPLEEGSILWCDVAIDDNPLIFKKNVSYIGHLLGLKALLTPVENLQFLAQLRGQSHSLNQIEQP